MILELLHYSFVQNALIAGSLVSISCALLGVFLVLRRMSVIGDGLSHVSFGGVALGLYLGIAPLIGSLIFAVIASLAIVILMKRAKVYGDAAIGVISSIGLSVGVILVSMAGGFTVDVYGYLFGNILAISPSEVVLSAVLSIVVVSIVYRYYGALSLVTFDPEYAQSKGVRTTAYHLMIAVLTAVTVALTTRIVGVILVSALLVFPPIIAMQVSRRFSTTIITSVLAGLVGVLGGMIVSLMWNLPAGASIVLVEVLILTTSYGAKTLSSRHTS